VEQLETEKLRHAVIVDGLASAADWIIKNHS